MALYHNLGKGKFEDVTKKAGLDRYGPAISCTAGDYDNDGFTDLAVSLGNRILLLHNEKNGTFKDVTQRPESRPRDQHRLLTFIDYDHDGDHRSVPSLTHDRDGDLDLYADHGHSDLSNTMWRNNGNGTFTDVTEPTGLRSLRLYSRRRWH